MEKFNKWLKRRDRTFHENITPVGLGQPLSGGGDTGGIGARGSNVGMSLANNFKNPQQKGYLDRIAVLRQKVNKEVQNITNKHKQELANANKNAQQNIETLKGKMQGAAKNAQDNGVMGAMYKHIDHFQNKVIPSFQQQTDKFFQTSIQQLEKGMSNMRFNFNNEGTPVKNFIPQNRPLPVAQAAQPQQVA